MEPKRNIVQRTGTLTGHEIAMDIDPAMTAHIMSVLTDLYSDSELACIRELSTNARDSHVEAGQTRPIEVVLPNAMNPYLVIRDFGTGLSVDEVESIYSKYGASTKRDSNDYNGMLGLGSKSPLTYTNQFMITARKNGVQIILSVSRLEDGRGGMTVIDTSATKEPNGVEIQIPVKRDHQFVQKTAEFFSYWPQGSVLVNGKQPERIEGEELAPGIFMVPGRQDRIVMGGVPYPVLKPLYPTEGSFGYSRQFGIVAFVEIGDVDFTPNREALKDKDPETVAKHEEIRGLVRKTLKKKIQNGINACPTHHDAVKKVALDVQTFRGTDIDMREFTYKGEQIPGEFRRKKDVPAVDGKGTITKDLGFAFYYPNRTRGNVSRQWTLIHNPTAFDGFVIVYNMPADEKPTATQRLKLRKWFEDNRGKFQVNGNSHHWSGFILVSEDFGGNWTRHVAKIDYLTEIKTIKLNESSRTTRKGKYDRLGANGYMEETSDLDDTKPIVFFSPAERYYAPDVRAALGKVEVVSIAQNRWDKFKRDWPQAVHVREFCKNLADTSKKALSDRDKIRIGIDSSERMVLAKFAPGDIDDPKIDEYVKALQGADSTEHKAYIAAGRLLDSMRMRGYTSIPVPNVLTGYPLVRYNRYSGPGQSELRHVKAYINMVYKEGI